MKASITTTKLKKTLIFVFLIFLWEIFSLIINKEIYLPTPISTFKVLFTLLTEKSTYQIILMSTYRTILGILISCVFGIMLGILCGLNDFFYNLLNPIVVVIRSTPVVSIIILAIIWLKSTNVPIFASFLMCFPIIFSNVTAGIKQTDSKLLQMAQVYNIKKTDIIKSIYLHSILPYIYSAIISSIGVAWKATSAAEVLSMPKYSIGSQLFLAKTHLEPATLFAWTFIIVVISNLFEKIFIRIFNHDKTQ